MKTTSSPRLMGKVSVSFLIRAMTIAFVFGFCATRSPAPVIEAPEPTPAAERQAPEEKAQAPAPTKARHKKAEPESKPKKETNARVKSATASPVKPTVPNIAGSKGFAGTWKGKMDGDNWTIVVNPEETSVTAYGPIFGAEGGAARIEGNTISWSHVSTKHKNSWMMKLQPGGRRVEVTAFHISGNITAILDKTN
jgi:hypothetical protein